MILLLFILYVEKKMQKVAFLPQLAREIAGGPWEAKLSYKGQVSRTPGGGKRILEVDG